MLQGRLTSEKVEQLAPPAPSLMPAQAPTGTVPADSLNELSIPAVSSMETAQGASPSEDPCRSDRDERAGRADHRTASLLEKVAIGLTNPDSWSAAGAAVICLGTSNVAVLGHSMSAIWSGRNLIRSRLAGHESDATESRRPGFAGIRGLAYDAMNSPGINEMIAGASYLVGSIDAFKQGRSFENIVFGISFLSCMAMLPVLNNGYEGTRTSHTAGERIFRSLWQRTPEHLKNLLKDSGLFLSLSNGALALGTLNLVEIIKQPAVASVTAVGIGVLGVGVLQSVYSLIRGKQTQTTLSTAVVMNAVANGTLSVASFLQGSPLVGVAKGMWLVACGLLAQRVLRMPPSSSESPSVKGEM